MKVLREDSTGEMEFSGTRSELLALGQQLRSGRGEVQLSVTPDPLPYSRSLSRIEFRQAGQKIRFSLAGDGDSLEIRGGADALNLLAENIEGFASEADLSDHLHVDYFPGHDYLEDGPGSLVIAIESGAPRMK